MNKFREILVSEKYENVKNIFNVLKKVKECLNSDNESLYFNENVNWDEFLNYYIRKIERNEVSKLVIEFEKSILSKLKYPSISAFDGLKPEDSNLGSIEDNIDRNVEILKDIVYLRFIFGNIRKNLESLEDKSNVHLKVVK